MIVHATHPGARSADPFWIVGSEGTDWLASDLPGTIRHIEENLRDLYDPAREITPWGSQNGNRPPSYVREALRHVARLDRRHLFRLIDQRQARRPYWARVVDWTNEDRVAGMIIEHLTDVGVLRLVGKSPVMLRLEIDELDAWVAAGWLALGGGGE